MIKILINILLFVTYLSLITCEEDKNNDIFNTIVKDHRLLKLTSYLEEFDLTDHIKKLEHATLFAPMNGAFEDSNININTITRQQMLYHIIKSDYTWKNLKDGMLLKTDTDQQFLTKITEKNGDFYVGNSAHIDKENIKATNGYVYIIDKLLSLPNNLDDTIASHPDLKDFSEKVISSGIDKELKDENSTYTVFAFKGYMFDHDKSMDPLQKSYLQTPEAKNDIARLLNYLIIPDIYYTTELKQGKTILKSVDGTEDLEIINRDEEITVNGIKVIEQDILSSNGVVHILEHPILPKDMSMFLKMNARKGLIGMNHGSRFVQLFDHYNISTYLDNESYVISLLVPPSDDLEDHLLPEYNIERWLKYHIIQGYHTPDKLKQHQLLLTESHGDMGSDQYQRIKVHTGDTTHPKDQSTLMLDKPSIQFGKVNVLGEPVRVSDNLIIYRVAHSLRLPREPLSHLISKHGFSKFFSSLFISHTDNIIKDTPGITLFVPTNEAFQRLGLVSNFLSQPSSENKLAKVVTFHAVHDLFYTNEMQSGECHEPTLEGSEIFINKTADGTIYLGSKNNNNAIAPGELVAEVDGKDTLISNGVMHTIDRVQIPENLMITNRDLMSTEDLRSFYLLLSKTSLAKRVLDRKEPYTILAPSDRAFSRIDFSKLLNDHDKLEELVRLHIIPNSFPDLDYDGMNGGGDQIGDSGIEFKTSFHDNYVVISKNLKGGYSVGVKSSRQESAYMTDFGRSSSGGGVIVIDRVLLAKDVPVDDDGNHGLPWWSILLIVIGVIVVLILLTMAGYSAWQWYRNREGQLELPVNT